MGKYDHMQKNASQGGDGRRVPWLKLKEGEVEEVAGVVGSRGFVTIPSNNPKYDDTIALHLIEVEAPVGETTETGECLLLLSHAVQRYRTEHVEPGWTVYMKLLGKKAGTNGRNDWWDYQVATEAPANQPAPPSDLPVHDPGPAAPKADDENLPFTWRASL